MQSVWSLTVNIGEVQRQMFHQKKQVEKLLEEEVSRQQETEREVEAAKQELKGLKATQKKNERSLNKLRMGKALPEVAP